MTTPALDFSDQAFADVEARRYDAAPAAENQNGATEADDLITVPEAARLLDNESRGHTHRRVVARELDAVWVGRKRFVRRAQVLDLRDAIRARRAPLPAKQSEAAHARSVATARARAIDDGREGRLEALEREVQALREELRSLRRLLIVKGAA